MKLIASLIVAVLLLLPQVAAAICVQGDCVNGQGSVVLQDGRRYVGEFKDSIRTGRGLMTFPDGTKYLGDWLNDKPNGQGTLTSVGKFEYAGEFDNGLRHGQGTLETVDGKKYVGQWQNDVPYGQGKIIYADGSLFVGQFENGRRNGEGEATYADGTKYTGNWKDDLPNGQGTKIFIDGEKYTGEFRNGLMHGQGSVIQPDGSSYTGQWQNDVLVKKDEIVMESQFATADDTVGDVLAVVDDKPAEVPEAAAVNETAEEFELPVPAAEITNIQAGYASVIQNGVFVRSGPSTEYRIVRSVNRGFPVQVSGQQDNWSYVKDFVGQEGWIYTPLLGPNNSAVVNASKVNLRSGPGLGFMVANQVEFGAVLQVKNIKDDWYMVTTRGGIEGWLSGNLVWPSGYKVVSSQDSSEAVAMMVPPEDLQSGPTEMKDRPVVEEIKVIAEQQLPSETPTSEMQKDVTVITTDQQQKIEEVIVEEVKDSSEIAQAEKTVEAKEAPISVEANSKKMEPGKAGNYASVSQNGKGANIRSEPSLASEVLRSIPPGFPLLIVEHQGDWVLVEDFRERRGWVYSTLLADPGTVVIKVGKGNLRSGPSTTDEIVAKLDYGIVLIVEEKKGEWVKVSNPEGFVGWLHNEVIWP